MMLPHLLLALVAAPFSGRFVEDVVPSARLTTLEAVVRLNASTPKQLAVMDLLAKSMMAGTEDYSHDELRLSTSATGGSFRVVAMPDHIRVRIVVGSSSWETGLRQLESLVRRASLTDEQVQEAKDILLEQGQSPWLQALDPVARPFASVTPKEVRAVYHAIGAAQVSVVISGNFPLGGARALWQDLTEGWKPGRFSPTDAEIAEFRRTTTAQVSSVELRGRPLESAQLHAAFLATFALGSGKGATVFQILRRKLAWSYRQESLLAPAPQGQFRIRILFAFGARPDESELPEGARQELLAAVQGWAEDDRLRALRLAESILTKGLLPIPLALTPSGVCTTDDQAFLMAYWPIVSGAPWSAKSVLEKLRTVTLSELKGAATQSLEGARPVLIHGRAKSSSVFSL